MCIVHVLSSKWKKDEATMPAMDTSVGTWLTDR